MDMTPPASGLRALGLGALEEQAYRALLRAPGRTARQLGDELGVPAPALAEAIGGLAHKRFLTVTPGPAGRLLPSPPDIAIQALCLLREREVQLARLEIESLEREQLQRVHGADVAPIVEVISDPTARALPYAQSHQRAVREVLCLVRPPFVVSSPGKGEDERAAARARGVRYRNIVHPDTLASKAWLATVREGIEAGEEMRLLAEFPLKMIVSDREIGLLPLDIANPEGPMMLLRGSAVLDALCDLFERLWNMATPIRIDGDGTVAVAGEASYPPQLEPLVPLLAAGANDKLIAERLGMSERTLMRRIDALYRTLHARSRFQAGWLAAMRAYGLHDAA